MWWPLDQPHPLLLVSVGSQGKYSPNFLDAPTAFSIKCRQELFSCSPWRWLRLSTLAYSYYCQRWQPGGAFAPPCCFLCHCLRNEEAKQLSPWDWVHHFFFLVTLFKSPARLPIGWELLLLLLLSRFSRVRLCATP